MSNFQPLSSTTHAGKRWKRPESFLFARTESLWPITIPELSQFLATYPIAFLKQGDGFAAVIMTSLDAGKNLFVTSDGTWPHGYIPLHCRAYPFRLLATEAGELVMGFDEDSGLLAEQGEVFFDAAGQANPLLQKLAQELGGYRQALLFTGAACATLAKHELIVPWALKVKIGEHERQIEGLFRVDEQRLQSVGAEVLLELRDSGALLLAHAQMFARVHLPFLCQLTEASMRAEAAVAAALQAGTAPVSAGGRELLLDKAVVPGSTLDFSGFR